MKRVITIGAIRGLAVTLPALLALAACGTGTSDFSGVNTSQITIAEGQAATVSVGSGAQAHFPAGTLAQRVVVVFSDILVSTDATSTYFPTAAKLPEDLLAAVVLNTPADVLLNQNIEVTWATREGVTAVANEQYVVYRYDFDNRRWNRWGSTVATMDAGGALATATLPTAGMYGFIGSLAIFAGLTETSQGAALPTVLKGSVKNEGGAPLATDVGLYYLIGTEKIPVPITGGRALTGSTVANAVDSLADGTFTMTIPDNLVGQLVAVEFGREDTSRAAQDHFDVLAPAETPVTDVLSMTIRYGENNVASQPVAPGV